ncbi:hypothetical protein ACFTSF_03525 [Kribbella sp. NPDC056951]|uniref:hypothetical protein n=1 Tax=Kribbella sp. NPDC056951 TaxID=3345978 RepID=UPI00363E6378
MSNRNRPLVIAVAAVAVVAVAGGGMLAAARGPESQTGAAAAPLSVPTIPPVTLPASKVVIDATKLPTGRTPQVSYLRGRTVQGGISSPVKVPGSVPVEAVARLWDTTMAMEVPNANSSSLVVLDEAGKVTQRLPGIDSLVTSADGNAAAFATGGRYTGHDGGTVHFRSTDGKDLTLDHARAREIEVLAVVDRSVYLSSRPEDSKTPNLYRWDVDASTVAEPLKVARPVAVSPDGTLAAGLPVFTDSGLCSVVTDLAKNRQQWRTCQYRLDNFSPRNAFVIGYAPNAGSPYGESTASALDAKTGKVLRTWLAESLRNAVPEDDDHVLFEWHNQAGPESRSAVVRCTVSTGQCELASPLSPEPLLLGS